MPCSLTLQTWRLCFWGKRVLAEVQAIGGRERSQEVVLWADNGLDQKGDSVFSLGTTEGGRIVERDCLKNRVVSVLVSCVLHGGVSPWVGMEANSCVSVSLWQEMWVVIERIGFETILNQSLFKNYCNFAHIDEFILNVAMFCLCWGIVQHGPLGVKSYKKAP